MKKEHRILVLDKYECGILLTLLMTFIMLIRDGRSIDWFDRKVLKGK